MLYFQHLYKQYLPRHKYNIWSQASKNYPPRITNMLTESYFTSMNCNQLKDKRILRLDNFPFFFMNDKIESNYNSKVNKRINPSSLFREQISKPLAQQKNMIKYMNQLWKDTKGNNVDKKEFYTNLALWLCDCDQQKFNSYFMCKHLLKHPIEKLNIKMIPFLSYESQIRITLPLLNE